jgi:hypothetical protein
VPQCGGGSSEYRLFERSERPPKAAQNHVKRRMWTLWTSPISTRKATHDDPP